MAGILTRSPSPSPSASPTVTCSDVIKSCDEALSKKDSELKVTNDLVKTEIDLNSDLQKENTTINGKLHSPLRSPLILIGVGALSFVPGVNVIAIGIGGFLLLFGN